MSSDELDFKKLHFASPDSPDRRWLEWFREEFSRQNYRVEMTPTPDVPFKIEGTTRILPDLVVYRGICSPMRSVHSAALVSSDDPFILVPLSGEMSMHSVSTDIVSTPGAGMLGSNETSGTLDVRSDAEFVSIRLKRRLLEPLVHDLGDRIGLPVPTGTQAMRLLLGYVRMLDDEETIATPEARHLVTTHVHDLAALVFGATRDAQHLGSERGVRAGRLAAIKADILANLVRPDLSVSAVAARQGMTPRYLQMLFEREGGSFTEFVLAQRLARAHRMLCDPRFAERQIGAIALSGGFSDLSYFNRTFRRRYGATPSDVREQARRATGKSS